ncbi:segregation and condensation protein A [Jeotgalicoccus coquinae]|uniref:Segregation and condensation protein A n=1 Tax=Jeotgalicoccus coquinae TaxID=709509 RepID=A0A6V7R9R5_9STAP|nr:segregation/condensation protein A [Jeotgalicoccus coquinae]MBB6422922.1 segregation and condensation protein A [Jeotgalicoccus coquinae]GGE12092.1 segregation and condensation protein A [Jeotgalicoccus coquinae]CAD2073645.1 Segregation and condensation protein A [Jeotgalicoccus coquinae]
MTAYKVKLDVFEGPLDLLLHLIKELEIDIYDIPMKMLTEQYMEYINQMKDLELNVASDYLVMASELVKIKSHMLLPEPPMADEDYEDPREQLMSQLIEYQNYKLYAEELNKLKEESRLQFVKAPHLFENDEDDTETLELSLHDLLEAYNKVKSRVSLTEESYVVVPREVYTKEEAVEFIASKFKDAKSLKMTELLTFDEPRSKVVQVFITILDYISQNLYQITRIDEDDFELERLA